MANNSKRATTLVGDEDGNNNNNNNQSNNDDSMLEDEDFDELNDLIFGSAQSFKNKNVHNTNKSRREKIESSAHTSDPLIASSVNGEGKQSKE